MTHDRVGWSTELLIQFKIYTHCEVVGTDANYEPSLSELKNCGGISVTYFSINETLAGAAAAVGEIQFETRMRRRHN